MTNPPRSSHDLIAVLQQDARNVPEPEVFLHSVTAEAAAKRRARRPQRWLLPALAAAVVAVVAVVTALLVVGHAHNGVAPAVPASADRNRQLTNAETIRLVALIRLPPGSAATTVQPPLLGYPAGGTPMSTSLIDTVRYWRVPLSYAKAVAWMTAHEPGGLQLGGTSGPTGAQKQFSGYIFNAPNSSAWAQASLQIGIVPSSSDSTAWRVDAMALWVDPRPIPDTTPGPRLRVTVAGGCPSSDQGADGVTNTATGLTTSLLPPGSPSAALFCVYSGLNGRAFALIRHVLLPAAEARRIAELARAAPLAHIDGFGPVSCPMDDGAATVLAFSYHHGSDVALWFRTNGCSYVSNGSIIAESIANVGPGNLLYAAVFAYTH